MSESKVLTVPLSEIVRSPFSVREGSDLTEITRSIEQVGVIEPIIVRKNSEGKYELVAGERRFSGSKAAGLKEIPAVIRELTDEQAFTIQSCENLHREDLTESEKVSLVTFYADHFGRKPKEIATILGMGYDWVLKYLPDRFKDQVKAEAGRVGGQVTQEKVLDAIKQTVKTQETPQFIECHNCHMGKHPNEIKMVDGKPYCLKCAPFAHAKPVEKIVNGVRLEKPTETWAFRKDRMQTPVSHTDLAILERVSARLRLNPAFNGWKVVFQKPYVLSIADLALEKEDGSREIAVYNDSPLHTGKRADKDERIRAILTERHVEVLALPFKTGSVKELDEMMVKVEELLKW